MTDTPIEYIRYAADSALVVPNLINLRPVTTTMVVSSWSGSRQGLGTETITSTLLTNGPSDGYTCNPRYRQVTAKEIAVSNGLLRDRDVVVGPLVFPYNVDFAQGGFNPLNWAPQATGANEIYFLLQGPDIPLTGVRYKLLHTVTDKNVMYRLYLRSTAAL